MVYLLPGQTSKDGDIYTLTCSKYTWNFFENATDLRSIIYIYMSGPQIFSKQENVAIQNENVLFFMKFPKVVVKPK